MVKVLYDRDRVRVSVEKAGEKLRLHVEAPGYVPRPQIETSYPIPLIQKLIEVKGPIWFADEIARDEDPTYVQRTMKWGTLPYINPETLQRARVLDFGCGSGASTAIFARTYPEAEIVGVELDADLIQLAKARAEFHGLDNLTMLHSPAPDRLPEGIGMFDVVNLSAVFEHLLPNERKSLVPMIWQHLKPGGVLFVYETPYRFFPIEMHTTGLPLINYLPRPLAHAVVNVAGRSEWRGKSWAYLERAGIRGATAGEVLRILGPQAEMLPVSRMGVRDRVQLWYAKALEGRRPQRSKDIVYKAMRTLKAITDIEMTPELSIAIRRKV